MKDLSVIFARNCFCLWLMNASGALDAVKLFMVCFTALIACQENV